jgi:hypothetical protein
VTVLSARATDDSGRLLPSLADHRQRQCFGIKTRFRDRLFFHLAAQTFGNAIRQIDDLIQNIAARVIPLTHRGATRR